MRQRRRGFSLVEILVALALTIFILSILSQAFVTGIDTFRQLKAVGDLNASLRIAATRLRADLSADHFEGKRRLSDANITTTPPEQGYFYLDQRVPFAPAAPANAPPALEGNDIFGLPSYRVATHRMAFTSKAKGTRQQDYFTANVPAVANITADLLNAGNPDGRYQNPGTFSSQWIEVCYWLEPIVSGNTKANGGAPLYALYRQQRLVLGYNGDINWLDTTKRVPYSAANWTALQPSISCQENPDATGGNSRFIYFNSPADLTMPPRRTATGKPAGFPYNKTLTPAPTFTRYVQNGAPSGDDLLLTDVISFEIDVLYSGSNAFTTPATQVLYDTWTHRQDDKYINYTAQNPWNTYTWPTLASAPIAALRITIRIWDPRTQLSRQISIVQEM